MCVCVSEWRERESGWTKRWANFSRWIDGWMEMEMDGMKTKINAFTKYVLVCVYFGFESLKKKDVLIY